MSEQIEKIKRDWIGAILGVFIAFIIGSYFVSQQEFIEVNKDPIHPIAVEAGSTVKYCREVTYLKESEVTIEKSLIKYYNGKEMIIIPFPSHVVFRSPDFNQTICKTIHLDEEMSKGRWVVETYVTRKDFAIWRKTIKLQDIYLDVE